MSFPFPTATIPELPNNATPPLTSLLEISNTGVSENTSIQDLLDAGGVEYQANKGAVSGYAGLDSNQELLLTNFPSGTALQILRRDAANTALEFVDPPQVSPLTTKGDLYTFDTDNQRLPVGSNGQILQANSATSTGLEWIAQPITGLVSINGDTTAAQILAGTTNRITVNDAGATHTFDIGTDVVTLSDAQTLLNKTIDAASNTITNLTNSSLQTGVFAAITGLGIQSQILNMGNFRIEALLTPVNGSDAATKSYVDNLVNGLSWKNPARLATTGNITLSANQTIDGFLTADGDRVLVKDQTAGAENGVYNANSGAWTRTTDTDESDELVNMSIYITAGTTQEDTSWVLTTDPPIVVDTTVLDYAQVGAGTGNPLTTKGDIFGYDTANARIPVGADNEFLMADSIAGLGVSYSLVNNINVATGRFSNITGVGSNFSLLTANTTAILELEADHTSPGGGELIGEIDFYDDDDAGFREIRSQIESRLDDPTSGIVEVALSFRTMSQGNLDNYIILNDNFDGLIHLQKPVLNNGGDFDNNQYQFTNVAGIIFDNPNMSIIQNANMELYVGNGLGFKYFYNAIDHHTISAQNAVFNAQNGTFVLELEANHTVPAAAQIINQINSIDDNSIGTRTTYAQIESRINFPTNLSEEGELYLRAISSGSLIPYITLNEGGLDVIKLGRNLNLDGFDIEGPNQITFDNTDNFITASGNFVMSAGSGSVFQIEFDGFTRAYSFDETEFGLDGANMTDVLNVTLNSGGKLTVNSDGTEAGFRDQGHTADPSSPAAGDFYYNTTSDLYRFYNGTIWSNIGGTGTSPLTTKGDIFTYDTGDARLPVGTNGQYLTANSATATGLEWITSLFGDVVGPGSASDNAICLFDGVTGKIIKNSTVTIDADGDTVFPRSIQLVNSATTPASSIYYMQITNGDFGFNVITGERYVFRIAGGTEMTLEAAGLNLQDKNLTMGTGYIDIEEIATPGNPVANVGRLYTKEVGGTHAELFYRDELGTETNLIAAGGASPLTTKGDIFTYDTGDARLPVGSNGQYLTANSAQATGLQWVTPSFGDVDGPGSAVNHNIAVFDGATGKLIDGAGSSGFEIIVDVAGQPTLPRNLIFTSFAVAPPAGTTGYIGNYSNVMTINGNQGVALLSQNSTRMTVNNTNVQINDLNVLIGTAYYELESISSPASSGAATKGRLFMDADNSQHLTIQRNGVEVDLEAGGSGDVVGPGSSTDNAIAIFNSTTGKIIQQSGATAQPILINDNAEMSGIRNTQFQLFNTTPGVGVEFIQAANSSLRYHARNTFTHSFGINGTTEFVITSTAINLNRNDVDQVGAVIFNTSGPITGGLATDPYLEYVSATHMQINVPTGDEIRLSVNDVDQYIFDVDALDIQGNNIIGVQNVVHDQSAITYNATLAFDFDIDQEQTLAPTGDLTTLTTSNRAAGKSKTIFITADTVNRTLTFNTSWRTNPATATVTITANTFGLLTFGCKGGAETDVYCAYAEFV